MCGFITIIKKSSGPNIDLNLFDQYLQHRGPDDKKDYVDDQFAGRFYRLSIIDLANGSQPFQRDHIVVFFNGEIYNYIELREQLIKKGVSFKTQSDTEVIAALYLTEGKDFLLKLNGMFSIVIWDKNLKQFFFARDRVGIKPLYYIELPHLIVISSEIKPLINFPGFKKTISPIALNDFLSYGHRLEDVLFEDVHSVKAGEAGIISVSNFKINSYIYWSLNTFDKISMSEAETREQILELYKDSLRLQIRSDVKVGTYLSGGIDSGVVVALASKLLPKISAYTLDFQDSTYSELSLAQELATRYNVDHKILSITSDEVFSKLPEILWACDDLIADTGVISNYAISKYAKADGCKVVLTGAGGDEIFAGYNYYFPSKKENLLKTFAPLNSLIKSIYEHNNALMNYKIYRAALFYLNDKKSYLSHIKVFNDLSWYVKNEHSINERKFVCPPGKDIHPITAKLYSDFTSYLPNNILNMVDRCTMMHGLEARVPILDHRIVEKVFSLVPELKYSGNQKKYLKKSTFKALLPENLLNAPKAGFNSPISRWLKSKGKIYFDQMINSKRFVQRPFWREDLIKKLNPAELTDQQAWTLFTLETFCRIHLDRNSSKINSLDELLD